MGATTVGLVATVGSMTVGSMTSVNLTLGSIESALMLNVEVESRFSAEVVEGVKDCVEDVECMGSKFEFDNRFFDDLIARSRLCSFNTVCCICFMHSFPSLGRSCDFLVSALGFAPSLPD